MPVNGFQTLGLFSEGIDCGHNFLLESTWGNRNLQALQFGCVNLECSVRCITQNGITRINAVAQCKKEIPVVLSVFRSSCSLCKMMISRKRLRTSSCCISLSIEIWQDEG